LWGSDLTAPAENGTMCQYMEANATGKRLRDGFTRPTT